MGKNKPGGDAAFNMPGPSPGNLPNKSPFLSNSFLIFIVRLFPSVANLLVIVWYSRHLPQDMYGKYQHFWIQMNVIYPLACFGIHVLVITYTPGFVLALLKRISGRQYVLYAFWVALLGGIFALLQCAVLNISFIISFLFITSFAVSVILESLLIIFRSYYSLIITSFLYAAAYCFVHLYALRTGFSLEGLFLSVMIITVVKLIIYAIVFARKIKESKVEVHTDVYDIAKIRSLWLHLGLYDVIQVLFNWIDKFIISLLLTAPVSAIYYNGSQNIPVLPLLLSATGNAVLMQLAGTQKQEETTNITILMNQSGRVLSCIMFPVFFFLFFFRQELIVWLLTDKYLQAVPIFAVALLVLPLRAYNFTTVLQRMHKGSIINAGAIADILLACALMYPLYLWLGLPGVALSFVVTTYLQAIFYLVYAAKLLHISPMKLIPYMDWATKLIVFAFLFIAIRYAGEAAFSGKIPLFLGGIAMVFMVGISLLMEFARQRKYGVI